MLGFCGGKNHSWMKKPIRLTVSVCVRTCVYVFKPLSLSLYLPIYLSPYGRAYNIQDYILIMSINYIFMKQESFNCIFVHFKHINCKS